MDEWNIAPTECLNLLYEITTQPQKKMLIYGKSGIGKSAIVQEFINEKIEKQDQKDTTRQYFKHKYPYIKYIEKYIDLLQKYDIPPRTIDHCLGFIAYNVSPIFIEVCIGKEIATQIEELKKETPYQYGKHSKEVK